MVKKEKVTVHEMIVVARTEAMISIRELVRKQWKYNREIAKRYGVDDDLYDLSKELVRFDIKRLRMVETLDSIIVDYLNVDAFTHKETIRY